jgi:hypothetical protein
MIFTLGTIIGFKLDDKLNTCMLALLYILKEKNNINHHTKIAD